jgi:hypothetical protein
MRALRSLLVAAVLAILGAFAQVACADSFQFIVKSTVVVHGSTPESNMADYCIGECNPVRISGSAGSGAYAFLPSMLFSLASRDTITSVTHASFDFGSPIWSTANVTGVIGGQYPVPDPSDPVSVPPTLGPAMIVSATLDQPEQLLLDWMGNTLDAGPFIWDQNGWVNFDVSFDLPGHNWHGFIGAYGSIEIPYTLEIDGTYVTPEPATLGLLGTALAVLVARLRRKAV